ncbi:redox-sensing transcriptional repressor Rex [Tuanshanicoccus lijuaniae]|uniref:redox-sensing transcriptional repressor Rex n=1 Tax=Aerococcaceae bacterium zg-1292 TaxID=2774330 RepID=UPI001934E624|nr:redox-sensing transcriptional repressor Rex [Aerococcaceae bacterium zg-1292]MBF6625211.1 redox-sensing transcriptional repressor Rex [Aerococcaceae bacterium zg-BR9]MBF6978338.1 redox-sensing transcriptional repressor Rex [Aerococcaceae bacterium zg-BR22]MBS4456577.1 redox-sensing transcriptional repressor Rex [Aerococcaceae bacterium zg-A91]MBS4458369.1 redox-sensing transcriptional repressor Rex [Aerococcaceae bacterium zg-BR33]
MHKEIPRATARRLPIYHRYLRFLHNAGKRRISSTELSEAVKVDSATIRRDFSYFGALGKRGYGYDVDYLLDFFSKTLNQDRLTSIGLIGVGHLGNALLNYNFRKNNNVRIGAAFDINQDLVGKVLSGVPVYSMDELEKQIEEQAIEIVILTVPQETASEVVERLVAVGVKGIMNFTPLRFDVPRTVRVQNVDLTTELQTLIYFIDSDLAEGEEDNHFMDVSYNFKF